MKILTLLFLTITYHFSYGQYQRSKSEYIEFLSSFYKDILTKEILSIADYQHYFGSYAIENEEYLFFKICEEKKSAIECSKEFDKHIGNPSNSKSIVFSQLRKTKKDQLVQGKPEDIEYILEDIKFYDELNPSSIGLDLKFPSGSKVHFYLNRYEDEPIYIQYIYCSNGESVFDNMFDGYQKSSLKRLAVINDPDGYTNLREGKGTDHAVIKAIKDDELFYFTPNSDNNWWKAQTLDDCTNGYVHKSRIAPYGYLSEDKKKSLQEKVKKLHEGRIPCYGK